MERRRVRKTPGGSSAGAAAAVGWGRGPGGLGVSIRRKADGIRGRRGGSSVVRALPFSRTCPHTLKNTTPHRHSHVVLANDPSSLCLAPAPGLGRANAARAPLTCGRCPPVGMEPDLVWGGHWPEDRPPGEDRGAGGGGGDWLPAAGPRGRRRRRRRAFPGLRPEVGNTVGPHPFSLPTDHW